jgi:hypothetical protein
MEEARRSTMPFTDRPQEPMTKEEFLDGIRDAVQDMADPGGCYQLMAREFTEVEHEVRRFDPVMATKLRAVVTSINDFGDYIKARAEFLGSQEEQKS